MLASQLLLAAPTRADDIYLDNGEMIEGKATRRGDKIEIEMGSGRLTLSADSVRRIESRESSVQRFERLYSALTPNDVDKRMQLAEFCRSHDMRARERELLEQVVALAPDHAEARRRLGYVKTAAGWRTHAEHMRAQGKVQRDGEWMSPEQAQQRDLAQARARASERERRTADAEIERQRMAVERQRLELERERLELERRRARAQQRTSVYYGGWGYGSFRPRGRAGSAHARQQLATPPPTFPINGVRDPRDDSWSLPGSRDPRDGLP